ncbi:MAG TPA: nickel pincer cofactor biosynthesis protein LarC [Candidatus Nanoarchaeia archaeon]|nr:nickel pincer cofactor biosynthesis protein LarC [Candidatus Nanoarchaeia archaeon]
MKALYFNCSSGISGDMIVGALLDLGADRQMLLDELKKLNLRNYKIRIKKVSRRGIRATKFNVITKPEHEHRHLSDINKIIDESGISQKAKQLSKKIFLSLAKAEAKVHNTSINEVHFHEVGAVDSIVDIVSASILMVHINPGKVFSGRITEGTGKVRFSHGIAKLPVPAVRELLRDCPMQFTRINRELVTPTGAAILKTVLNDFKSKDSFRILKRGFGAGSRDLAIPNALEVDMVNVKINVKNSGNAKEDKIILETNIDDMIPELYPYVIDKLIKVGAVEAFIQPVVMKKNRIGALLSVICEEKIKDKIIEAMFDETTTFGIRVNKLERVVLDREFRKVKTKYGDVGIKIGKLGSRIKSIKPEYEDCRKIAEKRKIPLKDVYREALKKL